MNRNYSFKSYDDHRELHSFPTRRSSDLSSSSRSRARSRSATAPAVASIAAHLKPVRRPGSTPACAPRSEEHTSELQSRENLVCRLLLEKKKPRLVIS